MARKARTLASLGLAGVFSCAQPAPSDESPSPEDQTPRYRLAVSSDHALIELWRDDLRLVALETGGIRLAHVDVVDDSRSYDPVFEIEAQWESPTVVEVVEARNNFLALRLEYPSGAWAAVRMQEDGAGRFGGHVYPHGDQPVVAMGLDAKVGADERFYGLGEVFDTPNHRGLVRHMQMEADSTLESQNNEAHVPVPLVVGTRGWGLFVEDRHVAIFDVAATMDDQIRYEVGKGPDGADGLAFHLYGAAHPLDVTARYYADTGLPHLPAPWALGPWVWRDENVDAAEVLADAAAMRDLELPGSAMWIDRPYATGVNAFDFNPAQFPDPPAMLQELHAQGFRVALWHTPYLSNGKEAVPALHNEAQASGYFPPKSGPNLNPWSKPIDFTNPEARAWWQEKLSNYTSAGIEGFKLDYAEDVLAGVNGVRFPWEFADGSTERTMQSAYQLFYHRTYAEMLGPDGGFLLCRAGTYGDQVNVSVIWPGDLDASLKTFREPIEGEVGVGGLPAAVAAGLSLGPSGFPLFASDTGGYQHAPPNKETFIRWFQHTALTPVMQVGTGSNDVAWQPTPENGFDDEVLDLYRIYTSLHIRLFPYLWSHIRALHEDGRPIVRAMGLAYPALADPDDTSYLLGDDLLVAPVIQAGATTRTVQFPPGQWVDWWTGEVREGGEAMQVEASLSSLPLYLRAGAIVPLLRPGVDTLSPATDPQVDSFANSPGVLHLRVVWTGEFTDAEFRLYDGTEVALDKGPDGGASLRVVPGEVFRQGVEVHLSPSPSGVTRDGQSLAPQPSEFTGAGKIALGPFTAPVALQISP